MKLWKVIGIGMVLWFTTIALVAFIGVVIYDSYVAYNEAEQQAVVKQREEQMSRIKNVCSQHQGVKSFEYGQGFICKDGSAHNLQPIE